MAEHSTRVVVIGAGYAGLLAAVRLAGKTRRQNVVITLVNATDVFVERLRLHQLAANQSIEQRPIASALRGTGVNFAQGLVSSIDTARREVVAQTGADARRIGYDHLIYALGSTIDRDTVPGVRAHAYTLTPSGPLSAVALRAALPAVNDVGGQVVICGAGATGIEAAAEFADAYPNLRVRLITRGAFGMFLGPQVADYMRRSLVRRGVLIQDHTTITEVRGDEVRTQAGNAIPFDLCLWAGGFAVPALARAAGLAVNERGQVLIDPFMRSLSHPEIYAIGDSAHPLEAPGVPVRMAAFTATVMGAHGADCLSAHLQGRTPKPFSFAYVGQGIALGRHDAIGFNNYPDDKPNAPYFTGRLGFEIREFFVRFLAATASLERRWPGFFFWVGKGRYAASQRRHRQTAQVEPSL
ncbi:MAG: FAD-dependent oxidoreductase [Chloroflexota bacterium]